MMLMTSCTLYRPLSEPWMKDDPVVGKTLMKKEFDTLKPPYGGPVTVAVYSFADKTGQRKPSTTTTNFSTAVTQGAEAYIIKSLQEVGHGTWFRVAERVGLDNLIKERQMIRQMREAYDGKQAKELPPMALAGIIGGYLLVILGTVLGAGHTRFVAQGGFEHWVDLDREHDVALDLEGMEHLELSSDRCRLGVECRDRVIDGPVERDSGGSCAAARPAMRSGRATNHRIAPWSQNTVKRLRHQKARPCAARIAR